MKTSLFFRGARAVASKSFVTYCREDCVGEKLSNREAYELKARETTMLFFLLAALGMDCAYDTPVLDSQWVN
jgi:hypothetical protein